MLPNENVSMSVGHLDHVLIVYSSIGRALACGLVRGSIPLSSH